MSSLLLLLFSSWYFFPESITACSCNIHLFQTAKDVVASHDALVNLFETIQLFLRRLDIYTRIRLPIEMIDLLGKIMSQVLYILALSTKEMKPQPQGRLSKYICVVYCSCLTLR